MGSREPEAVWRVIVVVAATFGSLGALVASNVRPVFAAIPAASAQLPDGGRIVTVGSVNTERMPVPGMSLCAMSKSALVGLTKRVARDLGSRGIAINLIQRGPNDTEMHSAYDLFAEGQRALVASGCSGKSEEIAGLVSYLLSPESAFVTGAVLTIDGGYTV